MKPSINFSDLEFQNGQLVKIKGHRPEYMGGQDLIRATKDIGALLYAARPQAIRDAADEAKIHTLGMDKARADRIVAAILSLIEMPKPRPPSFVFEAFCAKQGKCTTDGCGEEALDRIVMGGVGSDYCADCADKVRAQYAKDRAK